MASYNARSKAKVSAKVSSALLSLRHRNTYQGHVLLAWLRPVVNLGDPGAVLSSLVRSTCQYHKTGSHVNEIIESSRKKARTMVMSSLNTFEKIEEAIDHVNEQLPIYDSSIPAALDPNLKNASDRIEAQIPSELITQCVATLLMIDVLF